MIMGRKREYHETFLNFSNHFSFLTPVKQEILDKCVVKRYNIIVLLKLAGSAQGYAKNARKSSKNGGAQMNYHVEKVALQVWEKFNPMYDMEKSETPDWVDIKRKVGLEVVIAKSEKACKQENFAERNLGKDISTISNDSI